MGVLPDWMIREHCRIVPMEDGVKRQGVISYGLSSYGYDIRAGYDWKVFSNTWSAVVDPKHFDEKAFVCRRAAEHEYPSFSGMPPLMGRECRHCGILEGVDHGTCCTNNGVLIPPNSFALTESVEEFTVPRDCLALVIGKSTYARCGIVLNCTPLEPEWRGKITLEVSNTTPLPARVYAGEGIGQVLFFRSAGVTEANFAVFRRLLDPTRREHLSDTTLLQFLEEVLIPGGQCQVSYADKQGKYQDQHGLTLPKVD